MYPIPPRVAAVHDLSCFGRCSLAVIAPILSAMGVQCCPLPTGIFSTHTGGFTDIAIHDLTDYLTPAAGHWRGLGIGFDAIYTGFLASHRQIAVVEELFDILPARIKLVDPVMGDDGRPYSTYTPDMCADMIRLARRADILTPNLTEACILLGLPYPSAPPSWDEAAGMLSRLRLLGPDICVITGLHLADGRYGAAISWDDATAFAQAMHVGEHYPGTGDIFASVFLGAFLRGYSPINAAQTAADFVRGCAAATLASGTPPREGVAFELMMGQLCSM